MDQIAFSHRINTLCRVGHQRIRSRLLRRLRYSYLYPWFSCCLFPMPKGTKDGLSTLPDLQGFNERLTAEIDVRKKLLEQAEDFCQHCFSFLNLPSEKLGDPVDWRFAPGGDRLWQYQLHYGEWALNLAQVFLLSHDVSFRDALIRLLTDWIEHNPVGRGPGWEPYPISRRLVFWSRAGNALKEDLKWQTFWRYSLANSLRQQAQVLAANLEKDLDNNHLIANYRALAWMGLLFADWPEAEKWQAMGLEGLWAEMRRQVLSDGVHDERSISYHTIVLEELLEVWRLCVAMKVPVPKDVRPTLERMLQFLLGMQAPDGSYPMLNDTVPNYPMDPRDLLLAGAFMMNRQEWTPLLQGGESNHAACLMRKPPEHHAPGNGSPNRPPVVVYPDAGYIIFNSEADNHLYFDAGPMGPSHLPGHGHADALSFALFAKGRWLIVDPGVFSYHDPQWRDHFRSTQAHNTVAVDGRDQCVFWGPFRVAFPPAARLVEWSEDSVMGEHDGYKRLKNAVIHRRKIRKIKPGEFEITDSFTGRGDHDFLFNLQLAPGGSGEIGGLNGEIKWPEGISLKISCPKSLPGGVARIERGWVSFGWNRKEEAPRYVLKWKGRVPLENQIILKVEEGCD